ncbi:hypothetical protein ZWY2020_007846 [Hordeum vulgare]|nr:hypothetical protein ZWY2020_007846 [Hordeum vulgare]
MNEYQISSPSLLSTVLTRIRLAVAAREHRKRQAADARMSKDEAVVLGCHYRVTLRHVFYKARVAVSRLLGRAGLPLGGASVQDFMYDYVSYAHNFDNGEVDARR